MSLLQEKLREILASVIPIYLLVLLLHFTLTPLPAPLPALFTVSTLLVIAGLTLFNLGVENSIEKMGEVTGHGIVSRGKMPFLLTVCLAVGFMVTFAEPDLLVLGKQVENATLGILSSLLLVAVVSLGTAAFLALAMFRVIRRLSLKKVLSVSYLLAFGLGFLVWRVQPQLLNVAFDSGGVTTGPMTVPFVMAIGIGVANFLPAEEGQDDSFGAVAMASIGPILAMLVLALFFGSSPLDASAMASAEGEGGTLVLLLWETLRHECWNVFLTLLPMSLIFFLLNGFFFHISRSEVRSILWGLLIIYLGISCFLTGVNAGFSAVARRVGEALASLDTPLWLYLTAFVLGLLVVFAEPAIWVLNHNVEEVSGGHIQSRLMMLCLSLSVGIAVVLAALRTMLGFSLWWYLLPGYGLAFLLMPKAPALFTGIAFDSGGVSTGPMTATFILAFVLGIADARGANLLTDAFGLVTLVAMMPLIIIQALGILYEKKLRPQPQSLAWLEEETPHEDSPS